MTKTKNAKTYLTPSVKVVSFKVEDGFVSPSSPSKSLEQMDVNEGSAAGWENGWNS